MDGVLGVLLELHLVEGSRPAGHRRIGVGQPDATSSPAWAGMENVAVYACQPVPLKGMLARTVPVVRSSTSTSPPAAEPFVFPSKLSWYIVPGSYALLVETSGLMVEVCSSCARGGIRGERHAGRARVGLGVVQEGGAGGRSEPAPTVGQRGIRAGLLEASVGRDAHRVGIGAPAQVAVVVGVGSVGQHAIDVRHELVEG